MRRKMLAKMFIATAVVFAVVGITSTVVADAPSGSWAIDDDRSQIRFVSDAPMERFTGTSSAIEGEIRFDPDDPSATEGTIQFPVESVETGNSTRDRHLTQESWLHADEHPNVTFEIGEFEDVRVARGDERLDFEGTATGTVTMRGESNEEEAKVQVAVLPDQNLARVQFELDFSVRDYGVEGTRDRGIGSSVGETIDVEGTIYATAE